MHIFYVYIINFKYTQTAFSQSISFTARFHFLLC